MSSTFTDNENNIYGNVDRGVGVVTQARAMLANRISYWLHGVGPSFSVYNNWIGGMSALEVAYNLIKSGQCEGAVVGALNSAGQNNVHFAFSQFNLTSKDGKTKSFDENGKSEFHSKTESNRLFTRIKIYFSWRIRSQR